MRIILQQYVHAGIFPCLQDRLVSWGWTTAAVISPSKKLAVPVTRVVPRAPGSRVVLGAIFRRVVCQRRVQKSTFAAGFALSRTEPNAIPAFMFCTQVLPKPDHAGVGELYCFAHRCCQKPDHAGVGEPEEGVVG